MLAVFHPFYWGGGPTTGRNEKLYNIYKPFLWVKYIHIQLFQVQVQIWQPYRQPTGRIFKHRGPFHHQRDANFYLAKSKEKPLLKCFLLRQNLNVSYCFHEFCEPNPYKSFELTDQLFLLTANELITLGNFSFPGFKIGGKKKKLQEAGKKNQ